MTMSVQTEEPGASPEPGAGEELHEYAGGDIKERPGRVNLWLVPVYLGLFVWALYYMVVYWGGLGPGLDY
jgi:hypothetical protein